jgi:hypothetical protein
MVLVLQQLPAHLKHGSCALWSVDRRQWLLVCAAVQPQGACLASAAGGQAARPYVVLLLTCAVWRAEAMLQGVAPVHLATACSVPLPSVLRVLQCKCAQHIQQCCRLPAHVHRILACCNIHVTVLPSPPTAADMHALWGTTVRLPLGVLQVLQANSSPANAADPFQSCKCCKSCQVLPVQCVTCSAASSSAPKSASCKCCCKYPAHILSSPASAAATPAAPPRPLRNV